MATDHDTNGRPPVLRLEPRHIQALRPHLMLIHRGLVGAGPDELHVALVALSELQAVLGITDLDTTSGDGAGPALDAATRAKVEAILDVHYTAMQHSFTALAAVLDRDTVQQLDVDPDYLMEMLAGTALTSVRAMMEVFDDLPELLGLRLPAPPFEAEAGGAS